MAYYLVCATPKPDRLPKLAEKLRQNAFVSLRPFGPAVSHGLSNARWESATVAIWEEEGYCSPPLAMERAVVLDRYFDDTRVERVQKEEGWGRIVSLPKLF